MKIIEVIAEKLLDLGLKTIAGHFAKQRVILKLLKDFNVRLLKDDFDSVYVNALIEYGVGKRPTDWIRLFANEAVRCSLHSEIYKNKDGEFFKIANSALHTQGLHNLKSTVTNDILKEEILEFRTHFNNLLATTQSPFTLRKYYEDKEFQYQLLKEKEELSFDFQIHKHLENVNSNSKLKRFIHLDGIEINYSAIKQSDNLLASDKLESENLGWLSNSKKQITKGNSLLIQYRNWTHTDSNLLIVLGEYGTGKTTSLSHFHKLIVEDYQSDEQRTSASRIPLFLSLRNFEKTLEAFIITELNKLGISNINFTSFLNLVDNGTFLLILDGFDEMATNVDSDQKSRHMHQLERLLESPNSKTIISVRKEYFSSQKEFYDCYEFGKRHNCNIVEILPFSDFQIKEFLQTYTKNAEFYWSKIETSINLHDLSKRPVLLQLIVDYLPKISDKYIEQINAGFLYEFCITEELKRKSKELTFVVPSKDRLAILQEICSYLFKNNSLSFSASNSEIDLKRFFHVKNAWEYEKYAQEFLAFTFLLNDGDGVYRISHKSFRDFLMAKTFAEEIKAPNRKNNDTYSTVDSTYEVNVFLRDLGVNNNHIQYMLHQRNNVPVLVSNGINLMLLLDNPLYNKHISFNNSSIDLRSSGLNNIRAFSWIIYGIKEIDLSGNSLTDIEVFSKIQGHSIENLNLGMTEISDFTPISNFRNLKTLNVYGTEINETKTIAKFQELISLDISETRISSIDGLGGLKNLEYVDIAFTKVSSINFLIKKSIGKGFPIPKLSTLTVTESSYEKFKSQLEQVRPGVKVEPKMSGTRKYRM